MVSKILDATAFYAGIPFVSNDSFMTTSIVYEEIQHIKAKQGALEMLQQTNRLQIRDPSEKNIDIVKDASIKTGDNATISKQDMSIIVIKKRSYLNIEIGQINQVKWFQHSTHYQSCIIKYPHVISSFAQPYTFVY